jgi:hypothetical protein
MKPFVALGAIEAKDDPTGDVERANRSCEVEPLTGAAAEPISSTRDLCGSERTYRQSSMT